MTLEELQTAGVVRALDPAEVLGYPLINLDEQGIADVKCGKRLSCARTDDGAALAFDDGQRFCLVGQDRVFAIAQRQQKAIVALCVFSDGVSRHDVTVDKREG